MYPKKAFSFDIYIYENFPVSRIAYATRICHTRYGGIVLFRCDYCTLPSILTPMKTPPFSAAAVPLKQEGYASNW